MANIQNLKPFNSETAREAGRKGGVASGIAKRRKANLRKAMQLYTTLNSSLCQSQISSH